MGVVVGVVFVLIRFGLVLVGACELAGVGAGDLVDLDGLADWLGWWLSLVGGFGVFLYLLLFLGFCFWYLVAVALLEF